MKPRKRRTPNIQELPDECFERCSQDEPFTQILRKLDRAACPPQSPLQGRRQDNLSGLVPAPKAVRVVDAQHQQLDEAPQRSRSREGPALAEGKERCQTVDVGMRSRPFLNARMVGGAFGTPSRLPAVDLTPWELDRAISPERSWRNGICRSSSAGTPKSCPGGGTPSRYRLGDSRQRCVQSRELEDLQGLSGIFGDSGMTRSMAEIDVITTMSPHGKGSPSRFEGSPHVVCEAKDLMEKRGRLQRDLHDTERRLRVVLSANDAKPASRRIYTAPGGGTGSLCKVSHPESGAKEPFSPSKTLTRRKAAESEKSLRTQAARDCYTLFGPGSDGPTGPVIHGRWE